MIKLADSGNKVFVSLTYTEFNALADVAAAADVANGDTVSLVWIKTILDNVSNFQTELVDIKAKIAETDAMVSAMIT